MIANEDTILLVYYLLIHCSVVFSVKERHLIINMFPGETMALLVYVMIAGYALYFGSRLSETFVCFIY